MSATIKTSAVIAFVKLLECVSNNTDVLLLQTTDKHANRAVQEYNDSIHSSRSSQNYIEYCDHLAELFNGAAIRDEPDFVHLSAANIKNIAALLLKLKNNLDTILK